MISFKIQVERIRKVVRLLTLSKPSEIVFDLQGNTLRITATDTDFYQVFTLQAEGRKDGSFAIHSETLYRFLLSVNTQKIVFTEFSSHLRIKAEGTVNIRKSSTVFPQAPIIENPEEIGVEVEELLSLVEKVEFARAQKDRFSQELINVREELNHIYLEFSKSELISAASDQIVLARNKTEIRFEGKPRGVVVSFTALRSILKSVNSLGQLLKSPDIFSNPIFFIAKNHFICKTENWEHYSELVNNDTYLNYKSRIPEAGRFATTRTVNLKESLVRNLVFSKTVRIKLLKNELKIENDCFVETMFCDWQHGPFAFFVDTERLIECLKRIETEHVVLKVDTPATPIVILQDLFCTDVTKFFMVIMPKTIKETK